MRWNSKEGMVSGIQYLFPAFMHTATKDAFYKYMDRFNWNNFEANAKSCLNSLRFVGRDNSVYPNIFFIVTARWFHQYEQPSIKRSLRKFDRDTKDLAQECNNTALTEVLLGV